MFYYINSDDVIVGMGKNLHARYKSVSAGDIDVFGVDNAMGYRYKDGVLERSKGLIAKDEYISGLRYKKARAEQISKIVVTTTSKKSFDADEESQHRMLFAFQAAQITGKTAVKWKLADDSIQEISLDELKEALSLAANKMSEIFVGAKNGDQ